MEIKDVQRLLVAKGFGPLIIDGKDGPKTKEAVKKFQISRNLSGDGIVGPKTASALLEINGPEKPISSKKRIMTEREVFTFYGAPGDANNLIVINLPFPLRVSWSPGVCIQRMQVHKKIAEPLVEVFKDLLEAYGYDELKKLRIDMWGGTYNFRKMRGGTSWSKHAWAIAIDLDPDRNSLRSTRKTASFAKPEYKKMIDIFYKHGFVGLGPEKDYDWMHFEIGI